MQLGTPLSQYLIEEQRLYPEATGSFTLLMNDIALACKTISAAVRKGALVDVLGNADTSNCQDEQQKKLDIIANDLFIKNNIWRGHIAAMASEEMDEVYPIPEGQPKGKYLLVFDPLDGSSNIDVDGPIGTIFSIMRSDKENPTEADFLQQGTKQVCAGYCLYGPATMIVISIGHGVHAFTLDPDIGEFVLTHKSIQIPEESNEYSINHSNRLGWEKPMLKYVEDREAGKNGPKGKRYTMRWVGAMVMDVHRILMRGGMFAYPIDEGIRAKGGRLRLMYEANPISYLVEQAGGIATTGYERILDINPEKLHQRVPVILGSKSEVTDILNYHKDYAEENSIKFTHRCKLYQ